MFTPDQFAETCVAYERDLEALRVRHLNEINDQHDQTEEFYEERVRQLKEKHKNEIIDLVNDTNSGAAVIGFLVSGVSGAVVGFLVGYAVSPWL